MSTVRGRILIRRFVIPKFGAVICEDPCLRHFCLAKLSHNSDGQRSSCCCRLKKVMPDRQEGITV